MSDEKPTNCSGVFIDFSNLFWAIKQKDGFGNRVNYDICYKKLKGFVEKKHKPIFYNFYACEDINPKQEPYITKALKHKKFLDFIESLGYNVIRKDLKHIGGTTKCDTDVEITMDLHKNAFDLDEIVLITGDSDFLEAVRYFRSIGKRIHIYSFKSGLSWELELFARQYKDCGYTLFDDLRNVLERYKF